MEFTKTAPFSIELGARGDDPQLTFVKVVGDMDYVSGAEIAAAVRRPLETGQSVVIDLAEVTFMDSSGIAAILTVAREESARERLRLIPPTHRQPARLADLTGMTALFTLYEV